MSDLPAADSPCDRTSATLPPRIGKTNPLVIVAAAAVTLFSIVGIGVMTGLIPNAMSLSTSTSQSNSAAVAIPAIGSMATAPNGATLEATVAASEQNSENLPPRPSASTSLPPIQNPQLGQPNAKFENKGGTVSSSKSAGDIRRIDGYEQAPNGFQTQDNDLPKVYTSDPVANTLASESDARNSVVPPSKSYSSVPPACGDCGKVESVSAIARAGSSSGAGAVVGGLIGGVIGHQAGRGRGKDIATVAGVLGGALIGNEVEKSSSQALDYDVRIRMDAGGYRSIHLDQAEFRPGDYVRFVNGKLVRN